MAVARRGEVGTAYMPGQPADPHQPRPVLVVSADARNGARPHVMVVPIYSTGRLGPTRLIVPAKGTGLQYEQEKAPRRSPRRDLGEGPPVAQQQKLVTFGLTRSRCSHILLVRPARNAFPIPAGLPRLISLSAGCSGHLQGSPTSTTAEGPLRHRHVTPAQHPQNRRLPTARSAMVNARASCFLGSPSATLLYRFHQHVEAAKPVQLSPNQPLRLVRDVDGHRQHAGLSAELLLHLSQRLGATNGKRQLQTVVGVRAGNLQVQSAGGRPRRDSTLLHAA